MIKARLEDWHCVLAPVFENAGVLVEELDFGRGAELLDEYGNVLLSVVDELRVNPQLVLVREKHLLLARRSKTGQNVEVSSCRIVFGK